MKSGTTALAAAQHELARRVRALAAPDADSEDGTQCATLDGWIRADRGIGAAERVGIYAHAYFARLHDALREDYPSLHRALGDAGFHDLAKLYLMARPPHGFSLRTAGEDLAAFLAGPVGEPFRRRWPFAPDLAALEWAHVDVFDAPDTPVLAREALADVAPEDWVGLGFRTVAAHRILSLAWPVHRLRADWEADRPPSPIESAPTRVLVVRCGDRVLQRTLDDLEADAVRIVSAGGDFGAVCAQIAAGTGESEGPARALALLERWIAEGLLAGWSDS